MNNSFQYTGVIASTESPTLFLPGWGFEGSVLRLLHPAPAWIFPAGNLDPQTFEPDLLHFLESNSLRKVHLIGWSMGGMLGLDFGAKYPEKVASLTLVSVRPRWPSDEIAALLTDFNEDPEAFLKTFYRKCFLGDRDSYGVFCRQLQPHYLAGVRQNIEVMQRGLHYLEQFTVPDNLPDIPLRIIHGKQDVIAPVEEMLNPDGSALEVIQNSGHTVFLDERCTLQIELRKKTIREKFSRAAGSYDSYAVVQGEVARRLASKINVSEDIGRVGTILELGCGTGNFTAQLADRFPDARITALDFSPEMLEIARRKLSSRENIDFICADGEEFLGESRGRSFDLVASNGSLQWFADHDRSLRHISRVLVPGGVLLCSIFGPESLKKLGQGMKQLFGCQTSVAASGFPDVNRLQTILEKYFSRGASEQELIEKQYDSVQDLLVHIKKTGTGGWHKSASPTLTVSRLNRLNLWFHETYGGCRVNYQVHFLQAVK